MSVEKKREHIILGNFNLYYLVWRDICIQLPDRNLKNLLLMIEKYDLQLLLNKNTIIYEKAEHQSIINLIFALLFIFQSLIFYKIAKDFDYRFDHYLIITYFNL